MTNEEAINTLKSLKDYYNDKSEYCEDGYVGFDNEDNEALDMAIKALEHTDKIEESNFSTEQYKADIQGAYDCGYNCGYADAMNDIAESEVNADE